MAKGDHAFKVRPKGSTNGGYARPRVQIGFDDETRKSITVWAKFNNRSFAAEVRELVAMGLKTRRGTMSHDDIRIDNFILGGRAGIRRHQHTGLRKPRGL